MAKWGEGDPRWIVEERPDATNVNNWHWTEKDASQWSKDKIKELFTDLEIEDKLGKISIKDLSKCEGEASANNRKAKLIFFYEWNLKLNWEGKVASQDGSTTVSGEIEIPNLSEENQPDDVDVNINVLKGSGQEAEMLKEILRTKGTKCIREKVKAYMDSLKEEFASGMILPKKSDAPEPKSSAPVAKPTKNDEVKKASTEKPSNNVSPGKKMETKSISMKEMMKCSSDEFYRALTVKEMVQAFTQGPCTLDVRVGGKFELFGGNIEGEFIELVPNQKIVQKWRFKSWTAGHYSKVTIDIKDLGDCTEVNVTQDGIPSTDLERTQEGWRRYYWESMKNIFGFGSMLI